MAQSPFIRRTPAPAVPASNPIVRRAPEINTGPAIQRTPVNFNQQMPRQLSQLSPPPLLEPSARRIEIPGIRPPASPTGFRRVFDEFGEQLPPEHPSHPDHAAAMARLRPPPPPTPPTPAFKKGGAVKAKPKATAPVKKKAGGMIAKPKPKAAAVAPKAKGKAMPAFKKGGAVKAKGKR